MIPCIDYNMPEDEYHKIPSASNSKIGGMKKTAKHCKHRMNEGFKPSPQMKIGSILHAMVEGPDAFERNYHFGESVEKPLGNARKMVDEMMFELSHGKSSDSIFDLMGSLYAVVPAEMERKTKKGRAEYKVFEDECISECKTIIKNSDYDKVIAYIEFISRIGNRQVLTTKEVEAAGTMYESIMNHKSAKALLTSGRSEVTMQWEDHDTRYPCKARLDFVTDGGYIIDIKSTRDAGQSEFEKSIINFGYHRQNAFYKDAYEVCMGKPPKGFIFIAVENTAPYAAAAYMLSDDAVEVGSAENKKLLAEFADCARSGHWPGYSEQVELIELPKWYKG